MAEVLLDGLERLQERVWSITGYFTDPFEASVVGTFGGFFFQNTFLGREIRGTLCDYIGQSSFRGNFIPDIELDFEKVYAHEDRDLDRIRYKFRKEGPIWVGSYERQGRNQISGESRCITVPLTKLDDSERLQALIKSLSL